ncbi:glycosyl hydrolase family 32 [Leifsonia sp. NPDC080035]|uniref:beta-fructofuranosidase n=1 Tax=Leifsonia sp. NPDC080035 TaxID=3143936 RepID=A0AAU7GEM3_9MICO
MFSLPDSYVWDFWFADDGDQYHLFFLYASKALQNPDARHHRASIGHAVSRDLRSWSRIEDALVRSDAPAFDDVATWTGCVVRGDDGSWHMFYTGATLTPLGNVQSVGVATSDDLTTWHKKPGPLLEADPRWYELLSDGTWHDQAFRDPFVYKQEDGTWRMLITARSNHGAPDDRGVIATATSDDLEHWTVHPPLSEPGAGFGQLEVLNTAEIDGRSVLFFSCLASDLAAGRQETGTTGGVWAIIAGPDGTWDPRAAQQVSEHDLYVGRVLTDRSTGSAWFFAFRNTAPSGEWIGGITDPMPVTVVDGRVQIGEAALVALAG